MKKNKNDVIRIGDIVNVTDSTKFIKRIGYNLIWTDLIEETQEDPLLVKVMKILGMKFKGSIPFELVRGVAMCRVRDRNFGGNERKIHYLSKDEIFCSGFNNLHVIGKRIAKTGFRHGAYSWYDHASGCHEYENGSLEDAKTHIILRLDNGYEIESIFVNKVQ